MSDFTDKLDELGRICDDAGDPEVLPHTWRDLILTYPLEMQRATQILGALPDGRIHRRTYHAVKVVLDWDDDDALDDDTLAEAREVIAEEHDKEHDDGTA